MLGKLFKYDWKAFWKVPAAINIFLLIITAIGAISLISPLWRLEYQIIEALMIAAIMFYYLAVFAGVIAVFVYIAVRYYRNLYTDEGYLTHTLPVTPRDIILSKMFVGAIWSFITGLVVVLSVFIILAAAFKGYGAGSGIPETFLSAWKEVVPQIEAEIGMSIFTLILFVLANMIISTFFSILMMYSSISLGQLFTKHKVAGAIIWYIAEYIIIQTVSFVIMNLPLLQFITQPVIMEPGAAGLIVKIILSGSIAASLIGGFILYFITEFMIRKKLNLD